MRIYRAAFVVVFLVLLHGGRFAFSSPEWRVCTNPKSEQCYMPESCSNMGSGCWCEPGCYESTSTGLPNGGPCEQGDDAKKWCQPTESDPPNPEEHPTPVNTDPPPIQPLPEQDPCTNCIPPARSDARQYEQALDGICAGNHACACGYSCKVDVGPPIPLPGGGPNICMFGTCKEDGDCVGVVGQHHAFCVSGCCTRQSGDDLPNDRTCTAPQKDCGGECCLPQHCHGNRMTGYICESPSR